MLQRIKLIVKSSIKSLFLIVFLFTFLVNIKFTLLDDNNSNNKSDILGFEISLFEDANAAREPMSWCLFETGEKGCYRPAKANCWCLG